MCQFVLGAPHHFFRRTQGLRQDKGKAYRQKMSGNKKIGAISWVYQFLFQEAMTEAASGDSGLKRRIGDWARRVGLERNLKVVAENG